MDSDDDELSFLRRALGRAQESLAGAIRRDNLTLYRQCVKECRYLKERIELIDYPRQFAESNQRYFDYFSNNPITPRPHADPPN